jgi:putative ABC transport system substrate-binding protein
MISVTCRKISFAQDGFILSDRPYGTCRGVLSKNLGLSPGSLWASAQGVGVRRREFMTFLGGAAVGWPIAARSQQLAMPVVGFLHPLSPELFAPFVAAFLQGLKETGYVEGQNIAIEYRWAHNENDRLPGLAADLVRRRVAVIATPGSTPATLAAKAATTTIPIVFSIGSDPVKSGLVVSLNRPGGNVTGVTFLSTEIVAKRVELLKQMVPAVTMIGMLVNPNNPTLAEPDTREAQAAAGALGVQIHILQVSSERDFEPAFAALVQQRAGALFVAADAFFTCQRNQIVALAARHALPAIYGQREFAVAGGLMSYSTSLTEANRQAGVYVGRILAGDKPGDLPVVQSTRFDFVINLMTAKALGLDVPPGLSARADEIIE